MVGVGPSWRCQLGAQQRARGGGPTRCTGGARCEGAARCARRALPGRRPPGRQQLGDHSRDGQGGQVDFLACERARSAAGQSVLREGGPGKMAGKPPGPPARVLCSAVACSRHMAPRLTELLKAAVAALLLPTHACPCPQSMCSGMDGMASGPGPALPSPTLRAGSTPPWPLLGPPSHRALLAVSAARFAPSCALLRQHPPAMRRFIRSSISSSLIFCCSSLRRSCAPSQWAHQGA